MSRWTSIRGAGRRALDDAPDAPGAHPTDALLAAVDQVALAAEELEVDPNLVALAWEVVGRAPDLGDADRLALLVAATAVLASQAEGSTRVRLEGPVEGAPSVAAFAARLLPEGELVRGLGAASIAERSRALAESGAPADVLGPVERRRPLVVAGPWLSLRRVFEAEGRVAAAITRRAANAPSPAFDAAKLEAALVDVRTSSPTPLTDEQVGALRAAAGGRLTVVSGGPGTGKTTIVVALLRLLLRLGLGPADLLLAAPTARAGKRLDESFASQLARVVKPGPADEALRRAPRAVTLHRLLGYSPSADRFRHDEASPLAARLVVVDEASMIDVELMDRLLRAVPEGARLVLLGDADQLPSVGAGHVLRDLAPHGGPPPILAGRVVRLTHSHRMRADDPDGARILAAARAVLAGTPEPLLIDEGPASIVRRAGPSDVTFAGVEGLLGARVTHDLAPFLERWHATRVRTSGDWVHRVQRQYRLEGGRFVGDDDEAHLAALFAQLAASRVLCPNRGGRGGVTAVNEVLHTIHARALGLKRAGDLVVGEPVLMTRNDYERELWNGDQGLILRVTSPGQPPRSMAVFRGDDGRTRAFHLDLLRRDLERSFATTVHKAQGGEHDVVGVVLPDRPTPLLVREVLYTALTRARRAVVVVGDPELLAAGVRERIVRASGIADRLRQISPPEGAGGERRSDGEELDSGQGG
jgi:exodeoxyribonuclease V alpha subunit